jgi:heptosyltransferase III
MPERPNVLIIRRRFLGEIVMLGPLLRNLRLHWPDASLTVLTAARFTEAIALNADASAALAWPSRAVEWPAFLRKVRRARFTHVIDCETTKLSGVIARLCAAPVRVAVVDPARPVARRSADTHVGKDRRAKSPAAAGRPHEETSPRPSMAEHFLTALGPLDVPIATREFQCEPRADDVAAMQRFVGASERVLLVHPGARARHSRWPAERFAAVIDFAQDDLSAQVVLVGGPREELLLNDIRRRLRTHLLSVPGALTIGRFAALARISDAVLCHDSGFMPLAAAVGAPVVALVADADADAFAPQGAIHRLLQPNDLAAGVDAITIEQVCVAVRDTIGSRPRRTVLLPPKR